MFSSCCTNTIIISTLSTESIQRITSKYLPGCSQCHQGRSVWNPRVSIPALLPLTAFTESFFCLWKLCLTSCSSSTAPLHLPCSILSSPQFEHKGDHQNYLILRQLHNKKRRHKFCPEEFQNNLVDHLPPHTHTPSS